MNPLMSGLVALIVSPAAALCCTADDLASGLPITNVTITGMGNGNINLAGTITNNLGFTIGDFAIHTEIMAEGRDAPIARDDRPAHGGIAGGLMPGEAMQFGDWVHVGERGVALAEVAASLAVSITVIAAADADLRYVLSDGSAYAGWEDQRSPERCGTD